MKMIRVSSEELALQGELGLASTRELYEMLKEEFLNSSRTTPLKVNISEVTQMHTACAQTILAFSLEAHELQIEGANKAVLDMFQMTGLHRLLNLVSETGSKQNG